MAASAKPVFTGTLLSLRDGFGRLFAHGTGILLRPHNLRGRWADETCRRRVSVVSLGVALPVALYLFRGEPVGLLKIAGAIEAAHIPVVTGLTLSLNHRMLPKQLRGSRPVFTLTAIAGLFFAVFAVAYLLQLVGALGGN